MELCESQREVNDLKRTRIGGQAVIEGVMMKNGDHYAVAVRKPDHEIEVKVETYTPIGEKHKILKLPILRGIVNFFESLVIGVKTLTYSADFYEEEETEPSSKHDDIKKKDENEKKKSEKRIDGSEKLKDGNEKQETSDELLMIGTVIVSLIIAVALFMLLPAFLCGIDGACDKKQGSDFDCRGCNTTAYFSCICYPDIHDERHQTRIYVPWGGA